MVKVFQKVGEGWSVLNRSGSVFESVGLRRLGSLLRRECRAALRQVGEVQSKVAGCQPGGAVLQAVIARP